ncbi:MAG: HAD family hydrolase [Phycisphaerales bacterium JB038]
MLILFDVDATLLLTHGAGVRAMQRAGQRLYGSFELEGVQFAGGLDSIIFEDLAKANGIESNPKELQRFHDCYHEELLRGFANGDTSEALPGVKALLARLSGLQGLTLGLLTGNFELTGKLKIVKAGIDLSLFEFGVWAMDGATRNDLPPVAMRRYRQLRGEPIEPGRVVIIGDTKRDVNCAAHNGCRCLGVATGPFSVEDLLAEGAEAAFEDLSDTGAVVERILQPTPA